MAEILSIKGVAAAQSWAALKASMSISVNGIAQSQSSTSAYLINPVKISSVDAYSTSRIRITFDRTMKKDSKLLDVDNYLITPSSTVSAPIYYSEVIPESIASPRYVDIALDSEMTDGEQYDLEIATDDGPMSEDGNPLDITTNESTFTGTGILPEILSVKAVGLNRVDVIFTEAMTDNSGIRDASNYSFDKSLTVLGVLNVWSDTVQLATSDQTPGELYTLTVVPT